MYVNFRLALALVVWLASASFCQEVSHVHIGPDMLWGDLERVNDDLSFHRWSQGRLLAWSRRPSPTPRVGIYDSHVQLMNTVQLEIPGSAAAAITSVDLTRNGNLVLAGIATQADGAKARYVALILHNGRLSSVVRTGAYLAHYICAADDGSVWTVGDEWIGPGEIRQSGYSVLRQYSLRTGLVRELVSRDQIRGKDVSWGTMPYNAFLACNGSKVRFLSTISQQWFEYDRRTGLLTQDDLEPDASDITGLVVTPGGRVLASLVDKRSANQSRIFELAANDPNTGGRRREFRPVQGTTCALDTICIWNLLACEGKELVLVKGGLGAKQLYGSVLNDN
jgi:hypothetical protein